VTVPQSQDNLLTPDELQSLLKPTPAGPNPPPNAKYNYPGAGEWAQNLGIGVAKGVGQTIKGGGEMIRNASKYASDKLGVPDVMNNLPSLDLPINVNPTNYQQGVGSSLEHMGEYAMMSERLPFTALSQGLGSAALAGMHSGGNPGTMLGTGIIGAMVPPATKYVGNILSSLSGAIPQPLRAWWTGGGGGAAGAAGGGAAAGTQFGTKAAGLPPAAANFSWDPIPTYRWSGGTEQLNPKPVDQVGGANVYQMQLAEPTPPPQGQVSGRNSPQGGLPPGPNPPLQLTSAPGAMLPEGQGMDITPDPALPAHYANMKPPKAPPATMGGMRLGQEGGIPERGEQTVTPTKGPVHAAIKDKTTGQFRKMTAEEMQNFVQQFIQRKGTAGRTTSVEPAPPTPPKKAAAKGKK